MRWWLQLVVLAVAAPRGAEAENGIVSTHTCPIDPTSTQFYHIIPATHPAGLPDLNPGDRITRVRSIPHQPSLQ